MGLVSCLTWGHPVLDSGGFMVGLMATSMRTYNMMHLPGLLLPVPLSPGQATFDLLRRYSTGWSDSVSSCVTVPFPWVLVHTGFCLCPPRVKFLFPPVLCKSCNQIPLVFKVRFPDDSQSVCQIPRLGSLIWGIGPSQQWENFLDIIVLEIAGDPLGKHRVWFYCVCIPSTIWLWLPL